MRAMSIAAIANALIAIAPISAAADQTITELFTNNPQFDSSSSTKP